MLYYNQKLKTFTELSDSQAEEGFAEGLRLAKTGDYTETENGILTWNGNEMVSSTTVTLESQTTLANAECTTRINAKWNQTGQINASLGVYGETDQLACAAWIASNRNALIELLARENILDIDVSDNQYWPTYEEVSN